MFFIIASIYLAIAECNFWSAVKYLAFAKKLFPGVIIDFITTHPDFEITL